MTRDPYSTGPEHPLPEVAGYRLQRVLGHGGMSTVYLARQVSLEREVALKVMLPEALTDEISRRRFENEARTIARLDHPNIVGIFEVGRSRDGLPYYAMPYLPRGHLGQRNYSHDPAKVRAVLHALLSALDYAHGRGVVHRDVKAENVLFDDVERPLLADFGIALRRGYGTRVTTAGLAVGSTAYMPPEQARGHNVDGRADLYSVGVLGWEMLTGRLPYNAGDALSMALQHAQEPIPRLPKELRHWQRFFDKALAKTPDARYPGARDMRTALGKVPERAPVDWFGRISGPFGGRGRWWAAAAALVAALVIGLWWGAPSGLDGGRLIRMVPGVGSTSDGIGAQDAVQAADAVDSLMRPLPESAAERQVVAAETQLRQERWTTPPGDNAYESLMAAVEVDAHHPRLATTAEALVAALSRQAAAALQADDADAAFEVFARARRLAERIRLPAAKGASRPEAIVRMQADAEKALRARVDAANVARDRAAGARAVDDARRLRLDTVRIGRLQAAVDGIIAGAEGDAVPNEAGWTLMRGGERRIAIADHYVSFAEYQRFATATGRDSTRCRERGSLLRVFAPRNWKSPGFDQGPQQPVVCISWQDANAYVQWVRRRDGRRYRLATAQELQAAPISIARAVASWSDACGSSCALRIAGGRGWRGEGANRALEGDRGYDDVGFRLVREL